MSRAAGWRGALPRRGSVAGGFGRAAAGLALTRETRDTLFLLAVIAWTLLPQLGHVPAWCGVYAAAALVWRGWLALRGGALPGRRLLALALAVAAGGTWWSHQNLLGKEAGITLLVVLAALKTLELRARRDAVVVFFLGFVLVLANFLHTQSLAVALAMGVSVTGLLAALTLAHMPVGRPSLLGACRLALRGALLGAPVVLLLFLFFPRLPPLWAMPGPGVATTGLSDSLQLGQVAELVSDDSVAMRVSFAASAAPAREALYFRGPVLRRYDGRQWQTDDGGVAAEPGTRPPQALGAPQQLALAEPVEYTALLEPSRLRSLPLLELTLLPPQIDGAEAAEGIGGPPLLRDDLHWQTRQPLAERLRLRGQAYLRWQHADTAPAASTGAAPGLKDDDLQLPPGVHPRTRAWAQALRGAAELAGAPAAQRAERAAALVLGHIRQAGFAYALTPGSSSDPDPIDAFWLDHRVGFCEHYASAFVVIMRALGVPARIVTGYQGGQINPVDGWLEVRQSDAHAWAEVWLPERGWTRVDPTAAVAPERIRQGLRLRAPSGLLGGTLSAVDPAMLERMRQWWRAADHRWNEWVLQYGRQRQRDMLESLGWQSPDLFSAARTLLMALGGLALAGAVWAAWDGWRARRRNPWLRTLEQVQVTLRHRGLAVAETLPPRSLAQVVQQHWGDAGHPLAEALQDWDRLRYGPEAADAATARARQRHARTRLRCTLRALPALPNRPTPLPG